MINVESVLDQRLPGFTERRPILGRTLLYLLRYLCHEREFKQFERSYPHLEGFDFVEQALDYFDFSYRIKSSQIARIPVCGRVVIIANHPIGSLDGLALLKMVGDIRPDVKAVANEILYALPPLRSLLLPVDNMGHRSGREQIRAIHEHLQGEGALIIFPAGEVSRLSPTGVKDGCWNNGFLRFARHNDAPVLPVFVDGRNSIFFYALSLLAKPVSTLWLIREMFKQAKNHVDISVGSSVSPEQYRQLDLKPDAVAKVFKRHVYQLRKKKHRSSSALTDQYKAVAHPENRQLLKREIEQHEILGETRDGKQIFLFQNRPDSVVMREIGRLRELTFRSVREGTGLKRDIDRYDRYYDHVVLWDRDDLEIVGAYRMVRSATATRDHGGLPALYSYSLFKFHPPMDRHLRCGLELGRSFVQPQYWGKNSLDYLWQGIGAYLNKHPEVRYLFGPVSISHEYSDRAKALLVDFYQLYFGGSPSLAEPRNPYLRLISDPVPTFTGNRYADDFKLLKSEMAKLGHAVPTLFKQYTELCEPGGATFLGFNIDPDFANCVDGLILVDLAKLKESKRNRYLGSARRSQNHPLD